MKPLLSANYNTVFFPNFTLSNAIQCAHHQTPEDLGQTHFGDCSIVDHSSDTPPKQSPAHLRCKQCRKCAKELLGHPPTQKTINRVIHEAQPLYIDSGIQSLRHVRGAFTGPHIHHRSAQQRQAFETESRQPRSAADLLAEGYQYVAWTGQPIALFDSEHWLFACFTGSPDDASYMAAANRTFELIMQQSSSVSHTGAHRRGGFPVINFGLHHGIGLKAPQPIKLTKKVADVVNTLVSHPDVQCLAHFDSAAFQAWYPDLYQYYRETLDSLYSYAPQLRPKHFPRSIFPGCTINFGGEVWCYPHLDSNNLGGGICAIKALGRFDHCRSAHLVLHEAKVVVEFPANCTAFILSASCTHSNTPVYKGDQRVSMTQYAAGPIFRYVENNFMTEAALHESDPKKWAANEALKEDAWLRALCRIPTVSSMIEY